MKDTHLCVIKASALDILLKKVEFSTSCVSPFILRQRGGPVRMVFKVGLDLFRALSNINPFSFDLAFRVDKFV